jgi:hypothetical protein
MSLGDFTDLHGRGEPPLPNWDRPRSDEPAHGYFVRLVGLNDQISASVVASSFGMNGKELPPSECLHFAISFPVENKERLLLSTPTVNKSIVEMFGETFRRRDWSIKKRYFCPGCLAEDAYHRFFWDIVVFRQCPFHDQPLRCVDPSGHEVPWWSPSFEYSPFGNKLAQYRKRSTLVRPSVESYTLGRLGLIDNLPVPLLDSLPTFASVYSAIEFAGKLVIGGHLEAPPSTAALGKTTVFNAGFELLRKGEDAVKAVLRALANNEELKAGRKPSGLRFLFGWAYPAARETVHLGPIFTDLMIEVAAIQQGLTRTVEDLEGVKRRLRLTDVTCLAAEFGITEERVKKLAAALGFRSSRTQSPNQYVAFSGAEVVLLRRTFLDLIDRNAAAKLLDVPRPFLDSLVHFGLIRQFIRMKGPDGMKDRFRAEDIRSFNAKLTNKVPKVDDCPLDGRLLKQMQRTSRTNPARAVQQLIAGSIPVLGRCGETFGSIVIPKQVRNKALRAYRPNDTDGIGTFDAAAALGIAHAVVIKLRKLGHLKCYKPSPKLLDRRSFNAFCKRFSASRPYAPILRCDPAHVGRRLAALEVKMIRVDFNQYSSYLIDRASARRALNLQSDPDEVRTGSPQAFVAGLVERIRTATTFRMSSQRDGLTFRTGKGTLHLHVTVDWEKGNLTIGPRYNSRRTAEAALDLLRRRSQIDASFDGELTWDQSDNWLVIHKSMEQLPLTTSSSWPGIYLRVVETFMKFKTHFEPPQRRR